MVQTLQPPTKKFAKESSRCDLPEPVSSFGFPFARFFEDPWGWKGSFEDRWTPPPLDVAESDTAYMVAVDLPGIRKDDVRLQFENGVFTVSGDRKFEGQWKDWNLHRAERRAGSFCRSVALPSGVSMEGAKAEMRDGVLFVTFPKSEEARPHFLKID